MKFPPSFIYLSLWSHRIWLYLWARINYYHYLFRWSYIVQELTSGSSCRLDVCLWHATIVLFFWALLYFMALQDAPSSSSVSCPSPGTSHLTKVSFSKGYSETKIWLYVFSLLMGRPLFLSPLSRQSWQKHIEMCVCVSTIHISISISIHIFFKP